MNSREAIEIIKECTLYEDTGISTNDKNLLVEAIETIKKDIEKLEKYKTQINEYASIQGRNLKVSIEEVVRDFREIEEEK